MKRIEKLTPEQEALLLQQRDHWIKVGLSTEPADRERAEDGVRKAYRAAGLEPPRVIIWLDSPLAGAYGQALTGMLLTELAKGPKDQVRGQVWGQVGDQVWDQVGDQVRGQVGGQVWSQVGDQVRGQVGDQVWDQVGDRVRGQVGDQVGDQVWDQVWGQVGDQVRGQVGDQVGDQVWDQVWGQVWDQVWGQVWDQVWGQVWDQVWGQVRGQVWGQVRGQVGDQVWGQVGDQVWGQVGDQVWDQVWGQVWDQVWGQVRGQVGDQVWGQVGDQVWGQVRDQVWGQVGDQVWDQVWGQVWDQVWGQVRGQVGDQVWGQVGDQVWGQVRDQVRGQVEKWRDGLTDGWYQAPYTAWFDTMRKLGVQGLEPWDGMQQITESAGWVWVYRGFCILTERPVELHRDAQNRLHCETGPAVRYRDGFSVYAWHGVRCPQDLIETGWDVDRILRESNSEIRRCAIEKVGWDTLVDSMGLTPVATSPDPGNPGQSIDLYDLPSQVYEEPVRLIVVANGTVESDGRRRKFGLTVPASISDPVAAAAWTVDMPVGTYRALAARR